MRDNKPKPAILLYNAPENVSIWYILGALSMTVLAIQIASGIVLAMHYKPDADQAFASVEIIMRNVPRGWLTRHTQQTSASAFYLHMFRELLYGSHRKLREMILTLGCVILGPTQMPSIGGPAGHGNAELMPVRQHGVVTCTAGPTMPWLLT
jgi:quinol-cytochrome oxidoreductase complex cytochrome b subunit